jgi:hypothetical protein
MQGESTGFSGDIFKGGQQAKGDLMGFRFYFNPKA